MLINAFRVGLFLGLRQVRHASFWTTILIIFVMMLTFLNLVVVSGILVGLIEGGIKANKEQFSGDVYISTPSGEEYITDTNRILNTLSTIPAIQHISARFTKTGSIEANYQTRRDPQEIRDTVGARLVGINPAHEDAVTHLSRYVTEGVYLNDNDEGYILMGANLIERFVSGFGEGFDALADIFPGTKVRITVDGRTKEYIVKGIIDSKVDETAFRVFMTEQEFIRFVGRTNRNVNEVSITVADGVSPATVKQVLLDSGLGSSAVIREAQEAIPQFLEDIKATFGLLGNVIGSIGLIVASITIFIVIFINAITRKKYIGILKGIGIHSTAIKFSYVFQSLVYAGAGSLLGVIIIYTVLVPLFTAHPLNFPFADGILVAPLSGTLIRLSILIIATVIAGYVPARIITKKNTLDSILGR